MPRPRFDNLEPARRQALLAIAAEEFAEHGYEAASYNRIIERSGLSKGAIYYYFDDKEDLYATVLRDAMQRLVLDAGDMGSATDAASFWKEYEAWYVRSLHLFQDEPNGVGLARSLVKALSRGNATGALLELRQLSRSWVEGFLVHGQSLGAIRNDLPQDLLVPLVIALEEGIDLWLGNLIGGMSGSEIAKTATMLTALYRRVIGADVPAPTPKTSAKTKTKRSTHGKSR
jgi:AcrR family transcriptional regulator